MTKSIVLFTVIFSFMLMNGAAAKEAIGHISFILGAPGDVKIKHEDQNNWQAAKLKTEVFKADAIKTGEESRCEVKLKENSVIRIGENSVFEFTQAAISKSSKEIKTELKSGRVWSNLIKGKKNDEFQIKAPTAVCAVRGTIFRVDADTSTTCLVYDGSVDVGPVSFWGKPTSRTSKSLEPVEVPGPVEVPPPFEVSLDQWMEIVKGFQITVRPDGKFAKSRFDEKKDAAQDWVRWNIERDSEIKR